MGRTRVRVSSGSSPQRSQEESSLTVLEEEAITDDSPSVTAVFTR